MPPPLCLPPRRSPGLATLSGCAGTLMFLLTVFRFILGISIDAGPFDLFWLPILLTLYTGAYVMRGFRLMIMYHPHLRKRWGRCLKEAVISRNLVVSCVVLEIIVWSSTYIVGISRYVDVVYTEARFVPTPPCDALFSKEGLDRSQPHG